MNLDLGRRSKQSAVLLLCTTISINNKKGLRSGENTIDLGISFQTYSFLSLFALRSLGGGCKMLKDKFSGRRPGTVQKVPLYSCQLKELCRRTVRMIWETCDLISCRLVTHIEKHPSIRMSGMYFIVGEHSRVRAKVEAGSYGLT